MRNSKKKLANLLLQFILIFIAVFCSFLADDYRESLNYREFKRESLQGIYGNLKPDSISLYRNTQISQYVKKHGDALLKMTDKGLLTMDSAASCLEALLFGEIIISEASHYEAMKDAGKLTEIQNIKLRNSIIEYYEKDKKWIETFSSEIHRNRMFKFVDAVRPFIQLRENPEGLVSVKVIDKESMLQDPLWKNSLGEALALTKVKINAFQERKKNRRVLIGMIEKELEN